MNNEILFYLLILLIIISLVIIIFVGWQNNLKQQLFIKDVLHKNEITNNDEMEDLKRQLSLDFMNFQSNMSNFINDEINRLNENTSIKLLNIEHRVNDGLLHGFNKTNESFNNVLQQITKIDETQKSLSLLSSNIISLQNVLTDKKTRGIYGEIELYSILENVFGDNINFYEKQYKLSNGFIADCVIKTNDPLGKIVIDSKFPLENYNRIYDNNLSVDERNRARVNFRKDVLKHIYDIKNKYIVPFETADVAFMFIPAEAIFAKIHGKYDDIIQASYKAKVYLVSPTTLMAYITAIQAIYLEQKRSEKVELIQEEFEKLSIEFNRFQERYNIINKDFEKTYKDLNNLSITTDKIITRFKQIESVDLQGEKNESI